MGNACECACACACAWREKGEGKGREGSCIATACVPVNALHNTSLEYPCRTSFAQHSLAANLSQTNQSHPTKQHCHSPHVTKQQKNKITRQGLFLSIRLNHQLSLTCHFFVPLFDLSCPFSLRATSNSHHSSLQISQASSIIHFRAHLARGLWLASLVAFRGEEVFAVGHKVPLCMKHATATRAPGLYARRS